MSAQPSICTHILNGYRCERHVGDDGTHGLDPHIANVDCGGGEVETLVWRDVDSTEQCAAIE